jgi:histone deacetylase 1/2
MHDRVHTDRPCMHVSHIGHAFLPTHISRNLILSNILHVSAVKNNLLTVKKFTRDNDVFVEFHPSNFFVKDRATKNVLLRGRYCRGLYALDILLSLKSSLVF